MKTAVEWYELKIKNIEFWVETKQITWKEYHKEKNKLIEQAKEIERGQIIEAHFNGCETGEMFNNENRAFITDSEQYYNETFKQQEQ